MWQDLYLDGSLCGECLSPEGLLCRRICPQKDYYVGGSVPRRITMLEDLSPE